MKEKLMSARTLPTRPGRLFRSLPEHPAMQTFILCLLELAAGFLLAGGGIAGRAMPFAVCLIAVSASPLQALSAMLGSAVGYLYFWGFTGGLEYLAAGVLVFSALCIVGSADLINTGWFLPALVTSMSVIVGLLFLLQARFAPAALLWYGARLLLGAAVTWAMLGAIRRRSPGCLLCVWACFLSGCTAVTIAGGLTLAQILSTALSTAAAGTPCGLLLCVVSGLAVDISSAPPVSITALLCCAGTVCLGIRSHLRIIRTLVFLVVITGGVLFAGGQMPELVIAAALGCSLGMVLPTVWFSQLSVRSAGSLRQRLEQMSLILSDIHAALRRQTAAAESDAAAIFDRASDKVCSCCVLWNQCWQQHSTETYHALCAVARPMLERGAVAREDFPHSFTERCCHVDRLTAAINRELESLICRRQYQNRLEESRTILADQYAFLGEYLQQAAAEPSDEPYALPAYTPELGVGAAGRREHTISGDRGACFRTPEGMYYILLCDGMGTGPEAAGESSAAVKTLAGLIRAGLHPRSALQTLNGVYILRGDGCFSTIDLLAVDLTCGDATLYKWGAAPSYLKTRQETKKIGTAAPPPGFGVGETHRAAEYQLSLRGGEMLVLLSDGADGEDVWQLIAEWKDGAPKALAAALIAKAQTKGEDDMTAVTLRLRSCSALP